MRVEPRVERLKLGGEQGAVVGCRSGFGGVRERHAPDLSALLATVLREKFVEPSQQVTLGDHDIQREADAEPYIQFLNALAYRLAIACAVLLVPAHQVRHADGDDRAVERTPRAVLLEQIEK